MVTVFFTPPVVTCSTESRPEITSGFCGSILPFPYKVGASSLIFAPSTLLDRVKLLLKGLLQVPLTLLVMLYSPAPGTTGVGPDTVYSLVRGFKIGRAS